MKSPVAYGAGNVNMKGKKTHRMGCGCCVCLDKREEIRYKEDMKELNAHVGKLVKSPVSKIGVL